MEQIPEYINLLSYLFIVVYMLSVPLETRSGEILQTLGNLNLMGRALLANFVIIPILGILIARFFDLPADIRTGFLLLAMAPGGLLALQFARVSKGNRVLAVALLFVFEKSICLGVSGLSRHERYKRKSAEKSERFGTRSG